MLSFLSVDVLFMVIGGLLAFGVPIALIVSLSQLSSKNKQKDVESSEPPVDIAKLKFEFLDKLGSDFVDSLEISKALDELMGYLQDIISFSAASYVLDKENSTLVFKTHLMVSVPTSYMDAVKQKLRSKYSEYSKKDISTWEVENFTIGGPLDDNISAEVASFLSIPLYIDGELIGVFSLSSTKRNLYTESSESLMKEVLAAVIDSFNHVRKIVLREKEKLQAMVDSMNEGVLMVDRDFKLLVVNPAIYKFLGLDEKTSLNVLDVADHFAEKVSLEEVISKVFAMGGSEYFSEIAINGKFYELVVVPVSGGGSVLGVGVIIHDQTEEVELKKLRQEFSAMVIHELRAPLSAIRGTADLLITQSNNLPKESTAEFLKQMRSSANELLDMVANLLDAAKIEEGKIELFKNTVSVNNLLIQEGDFYSSLAKQQGIALSVELAESIGDISIDEKKIKQVLNNLISNALKFTESGGKIVLRSEDKGDLVHISVSDTGSGISDELKDKIFEKYVQGKDSDQKGTGLGLVITKGIVEAHGGKIWVEDNQPQGAKFIFTLPKG